MDTPVERRFSIQSGDQKSPDLVVEDVDVSQIPSYRFNLQNYEQRQENPLLILMLHKMNMIGQVLSNLENRLSTIETFLNNVQSAIDGGHI